MYIHVSKYLYIHTVCTIPRINLWEYVFYVQVSMYISTPTAILVSVLASCTSAFSWRSTRISDEDIKKYVLPVVPFEAN